MKGPFCEEHPDCREDLIGRISAKADDQVVRDLATCVGKKANWTAVKTTAVFVVTILAVVVTIAYKAYTSRAESVESDVKKNTEHLDAMAITSERTVTRLGAIEDILAELKSNADKGRETQSETLDELRRLNSQMERALDHVKENAKGRGR